ASNQHVVVKPGCNGNRGLAQRGTARSTRGLDTDSRYIRQTDGGRGVGGDVILVVKTGGCEIPHVVGLNHRSVNFCIAQRFLAGFGHQRLERTVWKDSKLCFPYSDNRYASHFYIKY